MRTESRRKVTWLSKFLGWIDYQNFPRYGASLARGLRARGVRCRYHRSHLALEDTEPLFKILYRFVCFKVSGKITDKYMKNLKEASGEIYLQVRPPSNLLLCSFSLQLIFFSEQPFHGKLFDIDSHTNTVISKMFAYSSRWRRKPWQGLFKKSL